MKSLQDGSNIVLLTMLGSGAFGNASEWIHGAIQSALEKTQAYGLDIRLVSYGKPSAQLLDLVERFTRAHIPQRISSETVSYRQSTHRGCTPLATHSTPSALNTASTGSE